MMRVVFITASRRGTASRCLPSLVAHPEIDVAMVIRTERQYRTRGRKLRRDFEKILRIGPSGALMGLHLRSWYADPATQDLETLARREGVRYEQTPLANGDETVELLRAANADLGLSLGNGYLFPKVFRVPKLGTINVHGEVLPEFRGGSSVIWPIHEGVRETGLTVHRMDERIDTGEILYQERFPIVFRGCLRATVEHNVAEISRRIPDALVHAITHFDELAAKGAPQGEGRGYTTPTFRQYRRMLRQHHRLSSGGSGGHNQM